MEPGNCGLGLGGVWHLNKAKATRATGVLMHKETDAGDVPIGLKQPAYLVWGSGKRKIADKNLHGAFLLRTTGPTAARQKWHQDESTPICLRLRSI
jgi:hypothetical protein